MKAQDLKTPVAVFAEQKLPQSQSKKLEKAGRPNELTNAPTFWSGARPATPLALDDARLQSGDGLLRQKILISCLEIPANARCTVAVRPFIYSEVAGRAQQGSQCAHVYINICVLHGLRTWQRLRNAQAPLRRQCILSKRDASTSCAEAPGLLKQHVYKRQKMWLRARTHGCRGPRTHTSVTDLCNAHLDTDLCRAPIHDWRKP